MECCERVDLMLTEGVFWLWLSWSHCHLSPVSIPGPAHHTCPDSSPKCRCECVYWTENNKTCSFGCCRQCQVHTSKPFRKYMDKTGKGNVSLTWWEALPAGKSDRINTRLYCPDLHLAFQIFTFRWKSLYLGEKYFFSSYGESTRLQKTSSKIPAHMWHWYAFVTFVCICDTQRS